MAFYNPMEPLFERLSYELGFTTDQIRYMVLMFMSYPLALIFRFVLRPGHTPLMVRYAYSLAMGTMIGLLCFGWEQMAILFMIVTVSYLLLIVVPPQYTQRYSMVWAMGSISSAHIYRLITDYGGFHLDFTGPLMILVQKITLIAFALHDGKARKPSQLSKDQQEQKITSVPGVLEYFCYMFNFHSLLAGPSCTIKEFLAFMDGSNISNSGVQKRGEPSWRFPVLTKLLQALVSLASFIGLTWYIDNDTILQPHHRQPFRLVLNYINSFRLRSRYYFIWMLSESINNCAGLGFAGYDDHGRPKWNLITNIDIWEIELATSMRSISIHWNAVSGLWLRRCVYERMTYSPTLATFIISAWWHGFYPGYYFCFIYVGIAVEASRKMRRLLRHHFQGSERLSVFYGCVTWLVTHLFLDYGVLCLDMMWASKSMTYWSYYYYIPIITVLVIALFFPSGKSRPSKVNTSESKADDGIAEDKKIKQE